MSIDPRPSDIPAIQRMDLFQQVLTSLETYIDGNDLAPGSRLPGDRTLATKLGVSRPLVRQAIKVLEGLGRLEAVQGVGTFVRDRRHSVAVRELISDIEVDARSLKQLLPVRIAIETAVLEAFFTTQTAEKVARLRSVLDSDGQVADDTDIDLRLDLAFESAIGELCENALLRRFQSLTHEIWLELNLNIGSSYEEKATFHEHHVEILDLLQEGRIDDATVTLKHHLAALDR